MCGTARNSQDRTWPVGTKKPNDFGLFDMHGNIAEWCFEVFSNEYDYVPGLVNDDVERKTLTLNDEQLRLNRGGKYSNVGADIRSADRYWMKVGSHIIQMGMRPARTIAQPNATGKLPIDGSSLMWDSASGEKVTNLVSGGPH